MSTNRKIRQLASELPFYPQEDPHGKFILIDCKVYGSELLEQDPDCKDHHGDPVLPTRRYRHKRYQPSNHFDNMKKAYKKGGDQAVIDYCKKVMTYDKESRKSTTPVPSGD